VVPFCERVICNEDRNIPRFGQPKWPNTACPHGALACPHSDSLRVLCTPGN